MKNKRMIVPLLAICTLVACSKSDSGDDSPNTTPVDSSKCILAEVNFPYGQNLPYSRSDIHLSYDSLKRITRNESANSYHLYTYEPGKITDRFYVNSVVDSNYVGRLAYTLDNNNRIVSKADASYFKPKNDNDYSRQDRTDYTYDADGYVTGQKLYAYGTQLWSESKLTYQNGNLVQRIVDHYDFVYKPGTLLGSDTITYTYNDLPWSSEAGYLYEVFDHSDAGDVTIGKPNKNMVAGIQLKILPGSRFGSSEFKSIQYTYLMKGAKVEKVNIVATTTSGTASSSFGFKYNCN